jgi:hypothetical protein
MSIPATRVLDKHEDISVEHLVMDDNHRRLLDREELMAFKRRVPCVLILVLQSE